MGSTPGGGLAVECSVHHFGSLIAAHCFYSRPARTNFVCVPTSVVAHLECSLCIWMMLRAVLHDTSTSAVA